VCLCLDSAYAVETVVFGLEGIVAGGKGRTRLVVDNSTLHPLRTRELAERLRSEAGIGWLDIPVSGGPVGAVAGTLAAMAGGDAEELEVVRPVVMSYANRLTHMGPIGSGQATKACNQIINFGTIAAIAEAFNVARHFGLDAEKLPEAIAGGFADSNMLARDREGARSGRKRKRRASDAEPARSLRGSRQQGPRRQAEHPDEGYRDCVGPFTGDGSCNAGAGPAR